MPQARALAALWKEEYNTQRPHNSLGYLPPRRVLGELREVRAYRRRPERPST